jgi:hypothetical protein
MIKDFETPKCFLFPMLISCSKHIAKQWIVGFWQCFAVSDNKDEGQLFHQRFVSSLESLKKTGFRYFLYGTIHWERAKATSWWKYLVPTSMVNNKNIPIALIAYKSKDKNPVAMPAAGILHFS